MTPATRGLDVFEGCGFENGLKGRKLMRRVLVQLKLKLKRGGEGGGGSERPRCDHVCVWWGQDARIAYVGGTSKGHHTPARKLMIDKRAAGTQTSGVGSGPTASALPRWD